MTPQAIAQDAIACWKAGAAIVHLHMRDDNGLGTMDKERFRETQQRIRDNCDVVIKGAGVAKVTVTCGDLSAITVVRGKKSW